MTGESTFTADVLESQRIKDPYEYLKNVQNMEDTSKAVSRYVTGGPVVGLNQFQRQQGLNEFLKGEFDRRAAAAGQAATIAGTIDERVAGAANDLFQGQEKAKNKAADYAQQQAQAFRTAQLDKDIGMQTINDRYREIDWTLEKNQTERNDKIENAYIDGTLNDRLLDLSISKGLRMQDIDQYYKLQVNEIDQTLKDWEQKQEIDFDQLKAKMIAESQAWATMYMGMMGIVDEILQTVLSKGGRYG